MKERILVTSPFSEITDLIHQVAAQIGIKLIIIEEVLDGAAQAVRNIVKDKPDIDVIISRRGTADAIKEFINLPLVIIEATDFDILQALLEAKEVSSRMGLLVYRNQQFDYSLKYIEEILGIQVQQYLFDNSKHLSEQIKKAYQDGIEVIVTGSEYGVKLAQAYGMKGALIPSSRRSIVHALSKARDILEVLDRERTNEEQLKIIINTAYKGIIALDRLESVALCNTTAAKIFNLNSSEVIGITKDELVQRTGVPDIFHAGGLTNKIYKVNNLQVIVDQYAITLKGENLGVVYTFQEVSKFQQVEQQIRKELHHKGLIAKFSFNNIVAESECMREVLQMAQQFGATDANVLITGESGTGKELLAHSLHQFSTRNKGPFVAVNCAALSDQLLESELFGYEEGAFTGAKKGGKPGLFELAHGGTIFLDEIGTIAPNIQSRLLRVLQEKEVWRVGGDRIVPLDVRVIAATNENLRRMVEESKFRQDLYFRLNVLHLKIPPLRERKQDIPVLIRNFLGVFNRTYGKSVEGFHSDIWQWFVNYSWPGNVRELENLVQRFVIITKGSVVDASSLSSIVEEAYAMPQSPFDFINRELISKGVPCKHTEISSEVIRQLETVVKNKSELATILGISRTTLWKRTKQ